jgi:hypothetical protein
MLLFYEVSILIIRSMERARAKAAQESELSDDSV